MSKDRRYDLTRRTSCDELWRYRRGSVTRRHFLGVTGLGLATAVLAQRHAGASAAPRFRAGRSRRHAELHHLAELPRPGEPRRVHRRDRRRTSTSTVFGSNEEMLAKLQAGGTGWDVFVPTNYTISTYDRPRPDRAARPVEAAELRRRARMRRASSARRKIDGKLYAVPKNWGTTGYRRQHRQGEGRDDKLEGVLGPHARRPDRPRHGARLPADHHRQRAEVFRLLLQLGRSGRAGRGREAADRGQAASLRHQQRLPAVDAQRRRLDVGRAGPATPRS